MSKSINVSTCRPLSFSILTSVFLLLLFSCKKPTEPPPPPSGPDTTSHNFIWRIDTLGYSGVLYDVAIIDENNIWAVGEIYLRDSAGQVVYPLYNVAQWDGTKWNLKRVTVNYLGNPITPVLQGIFAFSASQIWLMAGVPIYGNGTTWAQYHLFDMGILSQDDGGLTKAWGNSSSSMYFVGRKGTIVHYNGSSWQKIETPSGQGGTSITLTDIWGIPASGSQGEFVVAVGSDLMSGTNHHVFSVSPTGVKDTLSWTMNKTPFSVWFANPPTVYISGNGLWRHGDTTWRQELSFNFLNRVKGSGENNIFAVGSFAHVAHYNGSTWREYPPFPFANAVLRGLAVHPKIVVAVGDEADIPIVIRGYPQ